MENTTVQSKLKHFEEQANFFTHALGFVLSVIGMFFLLSAAGQDFLKTLSGIIFGSSLILLYMASTVYHGAKKDHVRYRLRILDHCAIYVLIAGTYTPFTLHTLGGDTGWFLFTVVWSLAFLGIAYKTFFINFFPVLSTFFYLAMGWLIVFFYEPLVSALPLEGTYLLIGGGLSYTLGSFIYLIEKPIFHHAIWHMFVLTGSTCHYLAILLFVL